jgi:uncharacterized protein (TIGR02266 family)
MSTEGAQGRQERRSYPRIPARIEIHFAHPEDAARTLRAYSLNFSAGGLCVRTKRPYVVGARLQLALQVDGDAYALEGVVAWVRGGAIGVRFENVTPGDHRRLTALASTLASRE